MAANSDTSAGGRVYYPGPGIVVTRAYIETSQARYRIGDLVIDDPSYLYAHPARAVALYCAVVELLLATGVAALYGSAGTLLCGSGAVAAAGLAGALWADDRRNPRRMELTAWYRGRRVVLFASADHRVFEQVRRAVIRAREANERPQP
ncbi:hypothetical protein GCM10020358_61180 [Amorphoplanes nipponensis]|uniref:Uncharacterized protein n=1 Tax=Actinoplanes nipponensis TaxID=135950 RepID=A0A919JNK5_9ACTN|nr:DUF6232 family protein [Actinoplanes nipponensis]GIE53921.1 hypothetical protein Ani05nite_74550 [Actinoplanes nipponensis]